MIDNILDGIIVYSNIFSSHGRVKLQERHIIAAVGFGVPIKIKYSLFIKYSNREGDRIR